MNAFGNNTDINNYVPALPSTSYAIWHERREVSHKISEGSALLHSEQLQHVSSLKYMVLHKDVHPPCSFFYFN